MDYLRKRDTLMLEFFKKAFSTRKTMQKLPPLDFLHELTSEELSALQECYLEMLRDIVSTCEKYNITYMAAGGTALGSIRHKGFIPWDDDVDLIMPREDLDRFVKIFDESLGNDYELTSPNSNYPLESMITGVYKKNTLKANLMTYGTDLPQGVHVDIFPIESVPQNVVLRRLKGILALGFQFIAVSSLLYHFRNEDKKAMFCQSASGRFNYCLRMTVGFLFSFRSYKKWGNLFDRFVRCKKDTGLWAVPTDIGHYFGHIMPKEVYYPPIKGMFENMEINLPHNPDAYLKNQYGDYMKIPPEEEREKHIAMGFCLDIAARDAESAN